MNTPKLLVPNMPGLTGNYEAMDFRPAMYSDWITRILFDEDLNPGDILLRVNCSGESAQDWYQVKEVINKLDCGDKYQKMQHWNTMAATRHHYTIEVGWIPDEDLATAQGLLVDYRKVQEVLEETETAES